jgi:hypothetical protein
MSFSWVTMIMVMPRCSRMPLKISMMCAEFTLSRLPVGSSASRIGGIVGQGARDGHALPLAGRELVGKMVHALPQAHLFSRAAARSAR